MGIGTREGIRNLFQYERAIKTKMKMAKNFQFNENRLRIGMYPNGRTSLVQIAEDGEMDAILSVNMPGINLASDEICIKNYSENEGALGDLIEAGVVSKPNYYVESGFVKIPVCKLLKEPPKLKR